MPTFPTPKPIGVTVELVVGEVRVTASDREDTVVAVEPSDAANASDLEAAGHTSVDFANGLLVVRGPKSWKRFSPFDSGGSVRVVLGVPTGSSLDAVSSLGELHSEGELGACQLRTAMGSIRVDHVGAALLKTSFGSINVDRAAGDLDATTGSGEIRIGAVHGDAVIKNSNGATRTGAVTGHMKVKAANGDITIERCERSLTAKTACGAIRVGEVRHGVVVLETSAGDLACGVAPGTAAWLDVRSRYGHVFSTLDASAVPSASDETVEIRARTSVGDINIHRAEEQEDTNTS